MMMNQFLMTIMVLGALGGKGVFAMVIANICLAIAFVAFGFQIGFIVGDLILRSCYKRGDK